MMKYVIGLMLFVALCFWFITGANTSEPVQSTCFGTSKAGRIENSVRLPEKEPNFVPYSLFGVFFGRTYVHSKVYRVIVDTYAELQKRYPDKIYMYGETGWKNGGAFAPHRTHQNGLSVDFMVPVTNKSNKSVALPTSPFNKFGYAIDFDTKGRYENFVIDWEATAAHLTVLNRKSRAHGISIRRVIFDPKLRVYLFRTKNGKYLRSNIVFSKRRSWVRHDEHYHVDFKVKCEPISN